jgi:hypothetical protein
MIFKSDEFETLTLKKLDGQREERPRRRTISMTGALEEPHYRWLSADTVRERDDPLLVAASRAHEHRAQGHHQERTKEEIDFDLESEERKRKKIREQFLNRMKP